MGLNLTAMDYRQYDNAIGRFVSMDMLSELSYDTTPYRFGLNNPNFWADPTGLFEQKNENRGLAICPTCPNTPEFRPLIDDPNNEYVYDPETKKASKVEQLDEIVIKSYKNSGFNDYYGLTEFSYNGLNDVLLGAGFGGTRELYNSNFASVNKYYYQFYKNFKRFNLPKPGAQRQFFKKIFSTSKFAKGSKLMRKAGLLGAALTVGNIAIDIGEDGQVKASSIIDGSLMLVALGATAVLTAPVAGVIGSCILIYGILDYTFDINDRIDANTEQIKLPYLPGQ